MNGKKGNYDFKNLHTLQPNKKTKKNKRNTTKNKNKNLIKKCLFYPTAYLYGLTGAGLLGVVRGA